MGGLFFIKSQKNKEQEEFRRKKNEKTAGKIICAFLGFLYIFLALGFLLNFLTYLLIIMLDPVPDRFIITLFYYLQKSNISSMHLIKNVNAAKRPHEITIYYWFVIASFISFLHVLISFTMILYKREYKNIKTPIIHLISSLMECFFFGFTTFMPFFLL